MRGKLTAPAGRDLPGQETFRDRTRPGDQHPGRLRQRRPEPDRRPPDGRRPKAYAASSPSPSGRRRRPCPCSRRRSPRNPRTRGMILPSIPPGPSPTPRSPPRSNRLRGCSPSDSPSARRCPWTSSSRSPRLSAPRAIVPLGSAPMPRARPSGWRRSGPVTGVPGGWLTISPPTRSARPTSGTARRDIFRSMSPDTWLRVGMTASPPPASPPCGCREPDRTTTPAWSWRHRSPNSRSSRNNSRTPGWSP